MKFVFENSGISKVTEWQASGTKLDVFEASQFFDYVAEDVFKRKLYQSEPTLNDLVNPLV